VVLALGEGRFKSVAVHLGAVVDGRAEVLHGLAAGDTVVTSAQFLLDSESSKTSDFMRMLPAQDHGEHDQHAASGTQPDATDADRHAGHGGATP